MEKSTTTVAGMAGRKPSICIVAHYAYGEMARVDTGHVGGVEHQTSLTARWFSARGYRVSLATWDEGQPDDTEIDGVRVIKMCGRHSGIPGLRFVHPRWTSLNGALRQANADLYYQNCGEYVTGQVAGWCARRGRAFVYSVASDPDCDPRLPHMKALRERVLYRYGLLHANRIVVQTLAQQRMLRDGFGIEAVHIPMPCPGIDAGAYRPPNPAAAGAAHVAWVGRVSEEKRPEWLVEVAKRIPEVTFDVVGIANRESSFTRTVLDRLEALPNVVIHGRIPRERMSEVYRKAACLLCTSAFEGFPNTFLEAWSHGVPVVSTFDPDGLIVRLDLGLTANSIPDLVDRLGTILNCSEKWRGASGNARRYYTENHALDVVMPRVEKLFLDAIDQVALNR